MRRYIVIVAALVIVVAAAVVLYAASSKTKTFSAENLIDYKPKPIPAEGKPVGKKVFQQKLQAFNQRMFVDAFKKYGNIDPQFHDGAVKFFEDYVSWMKSDGNIAALPELIKQGKALVDAGCDDPFLATCVGIAMHRNRQYREATPYLEKGLAGFEGKHAYPGYCASLAPKYLVLNHRAMRTLNRADNSRWMKLTTELMAKAQVDGSFRDDEMTLRVTFTLGNNIFPESEWRNLYEAMKEHSEIDPYILNLIHGAAEVKEAWSERGSRWAYLVTEEGWKGFEQHLEIAREALTKAWELHPEYPYAPANMIPVAMAGMAGPGETPRLWFDRSVAAQWDYELAYHQLGTALLPRWGGSVEDMHAFGVECVNTKRFDSDVPWFFLGVLKAIENEEGNSDCWRNPDTIKLMDQVFDGYEKTGFRHTPQWYRSARAATAWYSGRDDEAKRLINDLGEDLVTSAFFTTTSIGYETVKKALEAGLKMWDPVEWSQNGHYYQMCRPRVARTWDEVRTAAEGMTYNGKKGHLATFDSAEERDFVSSLPNVPGLYLIGALKNKDSHGWDWITDEPWKFAFIGGDPQANQPAESDLIGGLTTDGSGLFTWLTFPRETVLTSGFIVEYE